MSPRVPLVAPGSTNSWKPPMLLTHDDLSVSAAALEGPDIWIDKRIWRVFFVSGGLASALRKAGAAAPFYLKRCRVNDNPDP